MKHLQVLDKSGILIAVLNNAYKIEYKKQKNSLWTASFLMPLDDPKTEHIQAKYFIELYDHDRRIGRFVINPKQTIKDDNTNEIKYDCEHVLSLLHSDVLFQYHQYTNYTTSQVLGFLLANQQIKHWKLGTVEISRGFSYAWENEESLLNAIMSVAQPFNVPYMWTWNDSVYPFTLNLVEPSDDVKGLIISGKNLRGIEIHEDPTEIVTRIYALGFGEGVNQLTIKKVNGGVPYLEDATAVLKYGVQKRVWVDTRFEDATALKASAQGILDKYKEPIRSISIDCIDYSEIDPYELSRYEVGDILRVHDQDTGTDELIRIESMEKGDLYGAPHDLQLELGNVRDNFEGTVADLAKKQLVNDTYSQGATNIDSRDFSDNCDDTFPAKIRFPIPSDVVNINEMKLTFETTAYRAYSKAIEGGGATVIGATSSAGGAQSSSVKSSSSGGVHRHRMFDFVDQPGGAPTLPLNGYMAASNLAGDASFRFIEMYSDAGDLYTAGASDAHSHTLTLPAVASHTHDTEINIPSHTHPLRHGIYEYSTLPTSITIKVDGKTVPVSGTSGDDIDILPYLQKDADGKISRGRYAEIILAPNNLARINATVTSRLFIQSRQGITV